MLNQKSNNALRTAAQVATEHKLTRTQRLLVAHLISCDSPCVLEMCCGETQVLYRRDSKIAVPRVLRMTVLALRDKGVLVQVDSCSRNLPHGGPAHYSSKYTVNPAVLGVHVVDPSSAEAAR